MAQPISHLGQASISGVVLEPYQNHVEVEFYGVSFREAGALRYQYRLETVDHDWSRPSEERIVHLASVLRRTREYADDLLSGSGVRWTYTAPASLDHVKLDPQARRGLLLLLKEAITNVARHAHARSVSLNVEVTEGALRAESRDDGLGFDPGLGPAGHADHHGLDSMRARAERLGAARTIESSPGAGTRRSLHVPLLRSWERMIMLLPQRLRRRRIATASRRYVP